MISVNAPFVAIPAYVSGVTTVEPVIAAATNHTTNA